VKDALIFDWGGSVMRLCKLCLLPVLWLLSFTAIFPQHPYPTDYFISPVTIPISLSANFGELRANHFHSGVDIRTQQVEGKPVVAVADGYVSRIFISATGFGRAVYIDHPNGYTSVYGHLKSFSGGIAEFTREEQYRKESFAIDISVPAGKLPVKKGEVIALSGNSGTSFGPHLHFEIRDAAKQQPIDPILFGLNIPDFIRPKIKKIKVYPVGDSSLVQYGCNPVIREVAGWGMGHYLKTRDTLKVWGKVAFGIKATDLMNGSGSENGVNVIELYVDSLLVFSQYLTRFDFADTRYINSVIDYAEKQQSGMLFQRSVVDPGNQIPLFGEVIDRGIITITDTRPHEIKYIVKDGHGNASRLIFYILGVKPATGKEMACQKQQDYTRWFKWNEENSFKSGDLDIHLPNGVLYNDLGFRYTREPRTGNLFSAIHGLHDRFTPLHTYCDLKIKPEGLKSRYHSKAIIVKADGEKRSSVGGKWENGFVTTRIREFGRYAVMVDTIAPVITPRNVYNNKNIAAQKEIFIKIYDNLSGIDKYRATINGKWVLMEYDAKKRLLIYHIEDATMPRGRNTFVLEVKDAVGNKAAFTAVLIR